MAAALRPAVSADLPAIQAIYAHHVLHGTGTFEEQPPELAEVVRRHAEVTGQGLPWIVAEAGGEIVGYAYAALYRTRSAYRFTLEDSIYLDPSAAGRGVGRQLLARLIERATAAGGRQLLAVIGDSANAASIRLHARAGFRPVGTLASVGFKHGRWLDTVLMQLPLGDGDTTPP